MTWPKKYGGGERSQLERYVVIEEMLAFGAPTRCHATADRQSGPVLLRYGQQEIKEKILPRIIGEDIELVVQLSPDPLWIRAFPSPILARMYSPHRPERRRRTADGSSTAARSGPATRMKRII
jgi:hypothetical protein